MPYSTNVDQENLPLSAAARRHVVVCGAVSWLVGGRQLTLRPGGMLVLNEGQPYSIEIDEREPVETRAAPASGDFVV